MFKELINLTQTNLSSTSQKAIKLLLKWITLRAESPRYRECADVINKHRKFKKMESDN